MLDEQGSPAGIAPVFDRGFEGHRRRQTRIGLTLTPAQRLRWLEQTMQELRGIQGRARHGLPVDRGGGPGPTETAP